MKKQKKTFYSQYGQDAIVLELLKGQGHFYIDIGANDGVTGSNTKRMEELGWEGICVEPDTDVFRELEKNRKSKNLNVAVNDKRGKTKFTKISGYSQMLSGLTENYCEEHRQRILKEISQMGGSIEEVEVETVVFEDLLGGYPAGMKIDFVSIDAEGSEFSILKSIDFDKWDIRILAVENNYDDMEMRKYMKRKGYRVKKYDIVDDIYIKKAKELLRKR